MEWTTPKINTMDKALARGQLLLLNISSHTTRPIMMFSAPPKREGMTNSPKQGMKTKMDPATMPARLMGTVMSQKVFQGVAPKVLSGFKQAQVKLDQIGIKRQHHEGQVDIGHADQHGNIVVEQLQRFIYQAHCQHQVVDQSCICQQALPGVHPQ
jgi:hypothetical protein